MTFTSILFLFGFLPIGSALFLISNNQKWKLVILLLLSVFFIGWADPSHILLFAITILFNYEIGIIIGGKIQKEKFQTAKILVCIGVIANLFSLVVTRYAVTISDLINSISPISIPSENSPSPIGISYFCFTSISYLLDVYWGIITPEKNILVFSVYNIFFSKFIQGPITRYKLISSDLSNLNMNVDDVFTGIRRFIIGLSKKVLIADKLAVATNKIFESDYSNLGADLAWLGLLTFAIQIYLDFSGYTDMAIGVGQIFGIRLPENFNQPYASLSISEFWRRWHISLTSWFRTYLFTPLELATRKSRFNWQALNIFLVFLLTGLWHGASWNYIIWGGYFGIILALEATVVGKRLKKTNIVFQYAYTILIVFFGWALFRIQQIEMWPAFLNSLIGLNGWANQASLRNLNILFYLPHILIGLIICIPASHRLLKNLMNRIKFANYMFIGAYLALFLLCVAAIITNRFIPFIYQQF